MKARKRNYDYISLGYYDITEAITILFLDNYTNNLIFVIACNYFFLSVGLRYRTVYFYTHVHIYT